MTLLPVRPFYMRETLIHLGPVIKIEKRPVFYPQAHLASPSGQLICGFPLEIDGTEEDGSPVAGHAFYMCDDCEFEAEQMELDREEAELGFEALQIHEIELGMKGG